MAKKNTTETEKEKKESPSIGNLLKTRLTQRERNLALKADLIEQGKHPEPEEQKLGGPKERNLFLKNQMKEKEESKEKSKDHGKEKGKESTKESAKD